MRIKTIIEAKKMTEKRKSLPDEIMRRMDNYF